MFLKGKVLKTYYIYILTLISISNSFTCWVQSLESTGKQSAQDKQKIMFLTEVLFLHLDLLTLLMC